MIIKKNIVKYFITLLLTIGILTSCTTDQIENTEKPIKTLIESTTSTEISKIDNDINVTTTSTTSTTSTSSTTTTLPYKRIETIKDAQDELKKLYIYQGIVDGVNGSQTKSAIKEFQRRAGLITDGILGTNTKSSLEKGKDAYISLSKDDIAYMIIEYSEEFLEAQKTLFSLSIYKGDIDGYNGFQTIEAIKTFQSKAGLIVDGVLGPNTKSSLEKGEDAYVSINKEQVSNTPTTTTTVLSEASSTSTSAIDLKNYNPNATCITGYVNDQDIWVFDPCFYPVFVYRYGNTAQVNSQAELDAYLGQNWSLTKEKTYTSLGRVPTKNYTEGVNSPVNGLIMPSGSNNTIVIGIKNDNNVRARPQSGPQKADAVVEVLVEGGMTRFINIFYQSDTSYHGPIRSARPTDPTVLRPLDGVLVASGATGGLIPEILDIGVPVITDRRPEFFRITSRSAPHNLYADTYKLKALAINKGYRKSINPQPLFPWGDPNYNNWVNNSYLKLTFSSQTNTTWTWSGSTYIRTYYDAYKGSGNNNVHYWKDNNENSSQINADTIIALFCEPYMHPLQLPSVKTVGSGRAIILHNGKLLDAKWKRGSNLDPFHIVDSNDNILYVPPGKVWISLVPNTKTPSFG